jgi:GTPase SAR1 family protein
MYYRKAQAAILVFDLTRSDSLDALGDWLAELQSNHGRDIKLFLVGNKRDLVTERAVEPHRAAEFAEVHDVVCYLETSAKTGDGVMQLFTKVAEAITEKRISTEEVQIMSNERPDGSGCSC